MGIIHTVSLASLLSVGWPVALHALCCEQYPSRHFFFFSARATAQSPIFIIIFWLSYEVTRSSLVYTIHYTLCHIHILSEPVRLCRLCLIAAIFVCPCYSRQRQHQRCCLYIFHCALYVQRRCRRCVCYVYWCKDFVCLTHYVPLK